MLEGIGVKKRFNEQFAILHLQIWQIDSTNKGWGFWNNGNAKNHSTTNIVENGHQRQKFNNNFFFYLEFSI